MMFLHGFSNTGTPLIRKSQLNLAVTNVALLQATHSDTLEHLILRQAILTALLPVP